MKYWKADLGNGTLSESTDGVTFAAVANVLSWKLAYEYDADTGKAFAVVFVRVQDTNSAGVIIQQGQTPSNLFTPQREFRSAQVDTIVIAYNGVVAGNIAEPTGFPSGPLATRSQINSPFKENV